MRRRRSHWRLTVGGAVVMAAAIAVALVERYRFPKGSIWIVVGITALVVLLLRMSDRQK